MGPGNSENPCRTYISLTLDALEYAGCSVYLLYGLQKKSDDYRMKVAADQHAAGRREEQKVVSRDVLTNVDDAFWKVQSRRALE
jgi:hypothetical protein